MSVVIHLKCSNIFTYKLHGYTVHQQYWTLFYYQLMHITLKNAELLKHSKLDKNAPTCFGLHRNHLQGAKVTSFTQILLTKRVIFSQALALAPWRWFLCKPKHVGAFLSNLECFNNSAFLTLCASVANKRGFNFTYVINTDMLKKSSLHPISLDLEAVKTNFGCDNVSLSQQI